MRHALYFWSQNQISGQVAKKCDHFTRNCIMALVAQVSYVAHGSLVFACQDSGYRYVSPSPILKKDATQLQDY